MARTIAEIKREMTDKFIRNSTIKDLYGLADDENKTFEDQFSRVSIENILFYTFAFCAWTIEKLFDAHKAEVENYIDEMKPHSLRWYVNKAKAFRKGLSLMPNSDTYSDLKEDGMAYSDTEIAAMQIIKYASATENNGTVLIKVAKGEDQLEPLSKTSENSTKNEFAAVEEYFAEIKDAGVRIVLRSELADILRLELDVYYNPMILTSDGTALSGGSPVEDAINAYIRNLPFDGEYRNSALIDTLQQVEGVVIPELISTSSSINNIEFREIRTLEKPFSGYYTFDVQNSKINYIAYENVLN